MRKALNKLNHRLHGMRAGSVLILVVALLVLMALIGTAFLSSTRIGRYETVQTTNNTEIDLLVDGVKNMAKATIVGSLNDPSLPFPYRPANSSIAKNWDMPDLIHQYTDNTLIGTTPNDAWLSPRCPAFHATVSTDPPIELGTVPPTALAGVPVWPCIGEPLTGNTFESPFVLTYPITATGVSVPGALAANVPLTYHDRISSDFIPASVTRYPTNPTGNLAPGTATNYNYSSLLSPSSATLSYPDGTTATFPAFIITIPPPPATPGYPPLATSPAPLPLPTYYAYLAGDADGDGIADCGMFKLPVGQIDGITYYAGVRIVDNCAAVNVNTSLSRRFDLNGAGIPTGTFTAAGAPSFQGIYNLSSFASNVGLAELLQTYDGSAASNNAGNLGSEFSNWLYYRLNNQYPPPAVVTTNLGALATFPVEGGVSRPDFGFTTVGDLLSSQLGRRPSNTGSIASGFSCVPATDTDAAALAYHFVFPNPNSTRSRLELGLHSSLLDIAPNSSAVPANVPVSTYDTPPSAGPVTRTLINKTFGPYGYSSPQGASSSYVSNPNNAAYAATAWYSENFDWKDESLLPFDNSLLPESCQNVAGSTAPQAGDTARSRRSILTVDSAVSNLVPLPALNAFGAAFPIAVEPAVGGVYPMSQITNQLCKTSINTATFPDLWRAFWLAMVGDNGLSPLGNNSGFASGAGYTVPTPIVAGVATPYTDHDLSSGQSIYTGNQFSTPAPSGVAVTGQAVPNDNASQSEGAANAFSTPAGSPQHPQAMLRSTLRNPTGTGYQYPTPATRTDSYIESDQMVLLRSALAAANAEAMRDPLKGTAANIHAHDVQLAATIDGTATTVVARVYGVSCQPFITEVYASTDTTSTVTAVDTAGTSTPAQKNTVPYVAVELFNPYSQPISLNGWELASVDRSPASEGNAPNRRKMTLIHVFGANDYVPAYTSTAQRAAPGTTVYQGGYALLENLKYAGAVVTPSSPASPDAGDAAATYRPASADPRDTLPTATNGYIGTCPSPAAQTPANDPANVVPLHDIYVPGLQRLIALPGANFAGQELVLLRPVVGGSAVAPETVTDQVPVDSYDFTGLTYDPTKAPPDARADVWHYVRGNAVNITPAAAPNPAVLSGDSLWRFIYPGRYDASDPTPYLAADPSTPRPDQPPGIAPPTGAARTAVNNAPYAYWSRRQQGTQAAHFAPSATPDVTKDPFAPGGVYGFLSPTVSLGVYTTTTPVNPDPMNKSLNDNPAASYPVTFPFQYLNNNDPGPSPLLPAPGGVNAFPFGQFARNSDILQVPFVGSYVVFSAAPTVIPAASGIAQPLTAGELANIIEINPLPMDCSFAEDTDTSDDPPPSDAALASSPSASQYIWNEAVGHFAPVNTQAVDNVVAYRNQAIAGQTIADSDPTLSSTTAADPWTPYKVQYSADTAAQKYWRYRWSSRLFDYLTVQNPSDDYFPNVQQTIYNGTPPGYTVAPLAQPTPIPVQNTLSISPAASVIPSNPNTEDTVPVNGLININTAPWRVLSALRIVPYDDIETASDIYPPAAGGGPGPGNTVPDNTELAYAVAGWRDIGGSPVAPQTNPAGGGTYAYTTFKGPFTSIADLLNVPAVHQYLQSIDFQTASAEPDAIQGHLSPGGLNTAGAPLTDGARNDAEERFNLLSRLSNQITVKSDVYTVYIVVQGWRNAGSTSASNPPQMVSQRRAAFILDRTGVTPTSSNVKVINVPTD